MAEAVLDIRKVAHSITLTVHLRRLHEWDMRIVIARLLFRLAAWVMWVGVEFEDGEPSAQNP